ncbi:MAG: hypothetical protein K2X36_01125 [Microbacteriaceae bacterium]|nr:hypothetical protein [Microbacteriaceae bacterium]
MARILIADDEAGILLPIELWLTREGHTVLSAMDGVGALTLAIDELLITQFRPGELQECGAALLERA